ncbi:inteferon-activable protein 208-like isoform X15 [Apodemus sylvaticus]|uniref:inteferon-activable protein 208-like isoform X15 n=1 Tax=Apodemus sylvaticus TaxID=10129 RepID=UPI0022421093|nr:inteferon-activable protein 208-like isoform X15 [Apodemus sylvaticus]
MVNHYKKIVLLHGLEYMNDYNFRVLKSLLIQDLKLTKKMQDDYDRVKIADLMDEKFPEDAGLSKLIEVCECIPELGDRVDILRKEMEKVESETKIKSESSTLPLTSDMMKVWEVAPDMTTSSSEIESLSEPGAILVGSQTQRPSCLCLSECWGHIRKAQIFMWVLGSDLRSSCMCKYSCPVSHLSNPSLFLLKAFAKVAISLRI